MLLPAFWQVHTGLRVLKFGPSSHSLQYCGLYVLMHFVLVHRLVVLARSAHTGKAMMPHNCHPNWKRHRKKTEQWCLLEERLEITLATNINMFFSIFGLRYTFIFVISTGGAVTTKTYQTQYSPLGRWVKYSNKVPLSHQSALYKCCACICFHLTSHS